MKRKSGEGSSKNPDESAKKNSPLLLAVCILLSIAGCVWLYHNAATSEDSALLPQNAVNTPISEEATDSQNLNPENQAIVEAGKAEVIPNLKVENEVTDPNPDQLEVQGALKGFYEYFPKRKLIRVARTPTDQKGYYRTVSIFEVSDFKYPLIRVAEKMKESDAPAGSETPDQLVGRSAMVADHVLVKTKDDAPPEEFEKLIHENKGEIRSVELDSNILIVSFADAENPTRFGEVLDNLVASPFIESASPDYIATTPN